MLIGNTIDRNSGDGVQLLGADGNRVIGNTVLDNGGDGIFVDAQSSGNLFVANVLEGNGKFDAQDDSSGTGTAGTAGTADTWLDNQCGTADPAGLCSDPPPSARAAASYVASAFEDVLRRAPDDSALAY